jgi:hypothetical protein
MELPSLVHFVLLSKMSTFGPNLLQKKNNEFSLLSFMHQTVEPRVQTDEGNFCIP